MKHQHKKGRERPKQRKRNLQWRERTWTKGKPTQGTRKACTQKGSLEQKICKLRGDYTHTQNTRYLIDFAEIEQQQNHTRTQNTRWEAKYLIHYSEKEQQHQHNRVGKGREGERDESVRKQRGYMVCTRKRKRIRTDRHDTLQTGQEE